MSGFNGAVVSHESLAQTMSESEVYKTLDIGGAFINFARHPTHGEIVCISGCEDRSALIHCS